MQFCLEKKVETFIKDMSCLRAGFTVYGSGDVLLTKNRSKGGFKICSTLELREPISLGKTLDFTDHKLVSNLNVRAPKVDLYTGQPSFPFSKSLKWWEKSPQPNLIEIQSAQHLVDSLLSYGDRLVILDFYAPGCGGCKTLYPKICQLAETNPNTIFLKVNYDRHKPMCYALHVHVLPFFRLYKGAEGKVCSFSCTNATIKKFKDALSKHGGERCSLGPAKGLEETELAALASIGLLSRNCDEAALMMVA